MPRVPNSYKQFRQTTEKRNEKAVRVILGIDLGSKNCGTAVYDVQSGIVACDVIQVRSQDPFYRLVYICSKLIKLIEKANPDVVVIEEFYPQPGKNRGQTILSKMAGVISFFAFVRHGLIPIEINAMHARKLALGKGYHNKDAAHHTLLQSQLVSKLRGSQQPDAIDAFILAYAAHKQLGEGYEPTQTTI